MIKDKAIERLIQDDACDWAVEGFQTFQTLLDSHHQMIVTNQVAQIAQWASIIFQNKETDPSIRCAAGNFLAGLVTSKSKSGNV